jgi:hypothetical protein
MQQRNVHLCAFRTASQLAGSNGKAPESFTHDPESSEAVSADSFDALEGLDIEESDDGFEFSGGAGAGFGGGAATAAAGGWWDSSTGTSG